MNEQDYSNREIDSHFTAMNETLARIETQVLKTNGRVNKLERNMLVISCVVGTILLLKYPEVIKAIQLFL